MRTGQLYRQVRDRFRQAGLATPDLDARLLVSAALGVPVADLVLREDAEVTQEAAARAGTYEKLRLEGMPVGRILGEREFYGRRFFLNAATLEPRPDTETLVDAVLARTDPQQTGIMCDIGTGTGAIAVSLLAERPGCRMIAVDLSEEALQCALRNAGHHGVGERFYPVCADYMSCLRGGLDWVISNPPYIRSSVLAGLDREVIQHDPILALDGGDSGLEAYFHIVTDAASLLKPGGGIALEIGFDQAGDLEKQLRHHGFVAIEIIRDLSGNDRVAVARKA
ncbi:peptide chain release factor N(5)-glutamine methyltransferase [Labrenzia sp. 011]|uniref:peptide chain release factor N(5)-glutamine methyltransferase n=1 Tax=Labrenzia sp. 011 TaxID=2171494 RepID=UPI000D507A95|nr:peptide chain release factor N(5)-glutamine methyltransferase [Labrenzia sp. 011]PVB61563.1 peptide chain release factor N(5)-glutamine methyltransferase [Labrenzia sp. 011]